jgi:hypothetical protein
MEIRKGLCDFCARELYAEFNEKYPNGDDWKDGKPLWKEYRQAQKEREEVCVVTGDFYDDFAPHGDGRIEALMCKRHLQQALELLS